VPKRTRYVKDGGRSRRVCTKRMVGDFHDGYIAFLVKRVTGIARTKNLLHFGQAFATFDIPNSGEGGVGVNSGTQGLAISHRFTGLSARSIRLFVDAAPRSNQPVPVPERWRSGTLRSMRPAKCPSSANF